LVQTILPWGLIPQNVILALSPSLNGNWW
jgi:hypothetical protein